MKTVSILYSLPYFYAGSYRDKCRLRRAWQASLPFLSLSLSPRTGLAPASFCPLLSSMTPQSGLGKKNNNHKTTSGRLAFTLRTGRPAAVFPWGSRSGCASSHRRLSVCGGCGDPPPPAYQVDAQHPSHSCISGTKAGVAPTSARLLHILHSPLGNAHRPCDNTRGTSCWFLIVCLFVSVLKETVSVHF